MTKALFFNIPSSGHINPILPVLEALSDTDLEIVAINAESVRSQVEATETRFIAYPENELFTTFFANPPTDNFSRNALTLTRIGYALMPFVLDLIERENPDFILFDSLAHWGKLGARKMNKPTIAFVSTFVLTLADPPPMPPAAILMQLRQTLGIIPSFLGRMFRTWRTYDVKPIGLLGILMCLGEHNIVFTARAFQPSADTFDETFQFVGSSVGKRIDDPDFPFESLRDDLPKLYISLGTIAKNNEFLKRCFEAFREMPVQVIMSAGKQTDLSQLGAIPENFIVSNFVPQLDILEHVDVFITHSGMNSVHESLLAGVPLIAIPQQVEQSIVASQIAKRGAGIGLQLMSPFGDVSATELRGAVETVLHDASYKEAAEHLGNQIRAAGGIPRVVDLLLTYARTGQFG